MQPKKFANKWSAKSRLWILIATHYFFNLVYADKGYDKEEHPTGAYDAYCVPVDFKFELGLCQGTAGSVNVCAVTAEGEHPLSAVQWLNREVMPKGAPHMDKTIIQGDKSYNDLQKYFHTWVCKQVDPLSRPIVTLSDSQKKAAACKCVFDKLYSLQKKEKLECNSIVPFFFA